jgi:hypothetical protein
MTAPRLPRGSRSRSSSGSSHRAGGSFRVPWAREGDLGGGDGGGSGGGGNAEWRMPAALTPNLREGVVIEKGSEYTEAPRLCARGGDGDGGGGRTGVGLSVHQVECSCPI